METTLSAEGQVEVPGAVRDLLGLHAGDKLTVDVEAGKIVLTPAPARRYKVFIAPDPVTGIAVLHAEPGAPVLTSEQVAELLADFP